MDLQQELDQAYDLINTLEQENERLRNRLFAREKMRKCNPYKGRKRLLREESIEIISKYLKEVGESTVKEITEDLGWSEARFKRVINRYKSRFESRPDPRFRNRYLYRNIGQEPNRRFDNKVSVNTAEYKVQEFLKKHIAADLATLCNGLGYSQTQIFRTLKNLGNKITKTPSITDKRVTMYSLTNIDKISNIPIF